MSSRFRYVGVRVAGREVECRYDLDGRAFVETITLPDGPGLDRSALVQVARLLFLLVGVSYFKTAAPPVVDLGDTPVTAADRALLQAFYVEGLGEFADVNALDLTGLRFTGGLDTVTPTPYAGDGPLVPFGGGIDSVVVAEAVKVRSDPTPPSSSWGTVRGDRGAAGGDRSAGGPSVPPAGSTGPGPGPLVPATATSR